MEELTGNSNTVKGTISQLYDKAREKDKPVFFEINDIVIIVTPKRYVHWKRDIELIKYDGDETLTVRES